MGRKRLYPGIWRRFLDGKPEYLARHYWWAYLWRWGVWFFDHQFIINAILFGQYKKLSQRALLGCIKSRPRGRMLQLSCAYGSITPSLIKAMDGDIHLIDVAEIQIEAVQKKLTGRDNRRLHCVRMNAEYLAYGSDLFSTVLIFFLLHELPPGARERSIIEAIRVLKPGGRLVIAEYGACPKRHFLWRFPLTRYLFHRLEPFLESFWKVELMEILDKHARDQGKAVRQIDEFLCFSGFYRVCVYELIE